MPFTLFDILLLSITAISTIFGTYSGFLKLSINVIAFIASIIAAYFLYPLARELLSEYITHELTLGISAGALSYIISLIIFSVLSSKICLVIEPISGGLFDRLLGLISGLIRGIVICLLMFLALAIFTTGSYFSIENIQDVVKNIAKEKYPLWLQNSSTTKYFNIFIEHAKTHVSELQV